MNPFLDRPQLTITSRNSDPELARIHAAVETKLLVEGRMEIEEVLSTLLAARTAPPMPKTLDLVGHATTASLLEVGGWVIDRANPTVTAFFRELADHDVLPRLGISALRLLGCGTATTRRARETLIALTEILGLPVLGTTGIVHAGHFKRTGFDPAFASLLVGVRELGAPLEPAAAPAGGRTFDIDSLPAIPWIVNETRWPRYATSMEQGREVLALIRRGEGAEMPGLLARPLCELALPSARAGLHHVLQVMLEGEFVRVYPEGHAAGYLYPVRNPTALMELVATLPRVERSSEMI